MSLKLNPTNTMLKNDSKEALPVIDISPFFTSNVELQRETATKIHNACKDVGFFYLTGHGLSKDEMKGIRDVADAFFKLPDDEKSEISIQKIDYARGYQKLGQNVTSYAQDWHEGIDLYAPVTESHTLVKRGLKTMTGTNPTPRNP
jgi:isopenicillin N synthase-like dioxygenase